jgi:calpain-15
MNFNPTVSVNDSVGKDMQAVGLVSDHAYSVIAVVETEDDSGEPLKLLRLRNPWGHQEWSGDWSDESSKWTPALRQKLGL